MCIRDSGNVLPYHDYLVSGEWVMNLMQQGKMDFGPARTELVKVGKNLPRLLQCLDTERAGENPVQHEPLPMQCGSDVLQLR